MDNHPIPQDVTGFQFRLIGNMTVKQFAYLAAGTVVAAIFYYAPLPVLVKLIFIPLFAGLGTALAFLPVEGRPLDVMVSYFFKDLVSPTQYLYHKTGGRLPISVVQIHSTNKQKDERELEKKEHEEKAKQRAKQLSRFLKDSSAQHRSKLDQKEELYLQAVFDPTARTGILTVEEEDQKSLPPLAPEEAMRVKAAQSPEDMEHQLEKEAEAIKRELAKAREEEQKREQTNQPVEVAHEHVEELSAQLVEIQEQKKQLEQELLKLKEQLEKHAPKKSASEPVQPLKPSDNVRSIPAAKAQSLGLPALPDVPNIVIGIIKDPRGNVLPNILVDIKDPEGNPVRAFKTNALGQFASATPLPKGTYTLEFEDTRGKHSFETVSIEAKDEIMSPLEIISQDDRERLRQELFA